MTETTIPILPSRSINETLAFYEALGFETTFRQRVPNTYAVVRRGAVELHFFVIAKLEPSDNYGTCYVVTSDVDGLYAAFTAGLRNLIGKVPSRGAPRINPLKDMPFYGVRQFVVVDPAGNYIRIGQPLDAAALPEQASERPARSRLDRAVESASRLADGKGDPVAAARVLDGALAADDDADPVLRLRALVLRADLAAQLDDIPLATRLLDELQASDVDDAERPELSDEGRRILELRSICAAQQGNPRLTPRPDGPDRGRRRPT